MIYYTVSPDGDYLDIEDNVKGWFDLNINSGTFTNKRKAQVEQRRRIRARVAELKEIYKEIGK